MGLSALFPWVNCTPVRKAWDMFAVGTCWDPKVMVHYNIFWCLLGMFGYRPRLASLAVYLGPADEEEGKNRRWRRYEYGYLVSSRCTCPLLDLQP